MKNILLLVVSAAFLGLVIAFYFGTDRRVAEEEPPTELAITGEVMRIDRSGVALDGPVLVTVVAEDDQEYTVAIPSMSIQLCPARERLADLESITVGDIIAARGETDVENRLVPCVDLSHYLTVMSVVREEAAGYEFPYRKGPDGYIVFENTQSAAEEYVSGVILFNRAAYEEFTESDEPREGPPSLQVRVYTNEEKLSAAVWAMRHATETNVELAKAEPEEVVVGGANAVRFTADGLYPINTYVVAHGAHVYVLTGDFPQPADQLATDFTELVHSFRFIPTAQTNGSSTQPATP